MKRIRPLALVLSVVMLCAFLCGCRGAGVYREPNARYLVAAIGFDGEGGDIRVSMEVVVVSDDGGDSGISSEIFSAEGKTAQQAIAGLSSNVAKRLALSHCGMLVLGGGLTVQQLQSVFDYCTSEEEITLAAMVAAADNAAKLLSCESFSTPVTGYDLMGVIRQNGEDFGFGSHNRFYEISTARMQTLNVFALPYFRVKESGETLRYSFDGMKVYLNDKAAALLDRNEGACYAILRNVYDGGELYGKSGEAASGTLIKSGKTKIFGAEENGGLTLSLHIALKTEADSVLKADLAALQDSLNTDIPALIEKYRAAGDIFGFANELSAKNEALWNEIKDRYEQLYAQARITAVCEAEEG